MGLDGQLGRNRIWKRGSEVSAQVRWDKNIERCQTTMRTQLHHFPEQARYTFLSITVVNDSLHLLPRS